MKYQSIHICLLIILFISNSQTHPVRSLKVRDCKDIHREKSLGLSAFVVKQLLGCSSPCCVPVAGVGERSWHPFPFSQLSKSSYILVFSPELSTTYSPITRPLQHMSFCVLWSFLGLLSLFMFEAEVPAFLPFQNNFDSCKILSTARIQNIIRPESVTIPVCIEREKNRPV